MRIIPRVTALDILIVVLSAAAAAGAALWAAGPAGGRPELRVDTPAGAYVEPLDRDGTYRFAGPLGDTVVRVEGGKASVASSPCANQLCVHSAPAGAPGEWIACLPNKIFLKVTGGARAKEEGVDAASW